MTSYARNAYYFDQSQIFGGFLYGFLFIVCFSLAHTYLSSKEPGRSIHTPQKYNKNKIAFSTFIYIFVYIAHHYKYTDIDYIYAQKRDEVEGNHLLFLVNIILGALGYFLIIKLSEVGRRKTAFLTMLVIAVTGLFSGVGRYSLLITVCLMIITLFKVKLSPSTFLLGAILSPPLFPLIINLKELIFLIGTGSEISPDLLLEFYNLQDISDAYMSNFGHPVLSLLLSSETIEITGYRYFYDYIQGVLFFLRLFGIDAGYSLTYYNTYSFMGVMESIVPPGYVAFGVIQAHFLGVMISGFFFAFVGYACNFVRGKIAPTSGLAKFVFAFTAANTFYHGEMRLIVMTVFLVLTLMLLFNVVFKFES